MDFEGGLADNADLTEIKIDDLYIELDPNEGEVLERDEHEPTWAD